MLPSPRTFVFRAARAGVLTAAFFLFVWWNPFSWPLVLETESVAERGDDYTIATLLLGFVILFVVGAVFYVMVQAKLLADSKPSYGYVRTVIPSEVKQAVFARDGGACARCGAVHDLQFDHVIPVSRGGGNSYENVQVLCGPCNRAKSARIE